MKTECNLQHFARNFRIKNLYGFERDEADVVFVESRTFKYEGERHDHMLHYEQVIGNVFERRESKCCAVLMKHCPKVKGEQVITLQMAQQLKNKNINVAPGQLFCRQRKAKFLLEKVTTLMIKINFNRLQRLTMNSLIVKHQGKSSNQLAIQLSADMHL